MIKKTLAYFNVSEVRRVVNALERLVFSKTAL